MARLRLRHGNFLNWHLSSSYLSLFLFFSLSLSFTSRFPFFLPFSPYYTSSSPLSSPVLRFRHYYSRVWYAPCSSAAWRSWRFRPDTLFHYLFPQRWLQDVMSMGAVNFRHREEIRRFWVPKRDLDYTCSLHWAQLFFPSLKFNKTLQLIRFRILKLPLAEQLQITM